MFAVGVDFVRASGKAIGTHGIVTNKILDKFDIEQEVYFAELDWDMQMKEASKAKITYAEISKYPPVKRDLALLVDSGVKFSEIEAVAYDTDKKLLKDVKLFDVYEGKNLPAGKKSYAVSFILQDENKTLNEKQIENIMSRLIKSFDTKLGAPLR